MTVLYVQIVPEQSHGHHKLSTSVVVRQLVDIPWQLWLLVS